jgi:hypothetical protein
MKNGIIFAMIMIAVFALAFTLIHWFNVFIYPP